MALRGGWRTVLVLAAPVLSAMLITSGGVGSPISHADIWSETGQVSMDGVTAAAGAGRSAARRRDAKADLNGDGYSDLVVGGTVVGATTVGWSVSVIYGGRGEFGGRGNQLWPAAVRSVGRRQLVATWPRGTSTATDSTTLPSASKRRSNGSASSTARRADCPRNVARSGCLRSSTGWRPMTTTGHSAKPWSPATSAAASKTTWPSARASGVAAVAR